MAFSTPLDPSFGTARGMTLVEATATSSPCIVVCLDLTLAQVRPRSGLAAKHGVTVLNSPGTIDADYRGEVGVVLINHGAETFPVERGMRIAQMIVAPVAVAVWREVGDLDDTQRGGGGFGSTGTESAA